MANRYYRVNLLNFYTVTFKCWAQIFCPISNGLECLKFVCNTSNFIRRLYRSIIDGYFLTNRHQKILSIIALERVKRINYRLRDV